MNFKNSIFKTNNLEETQSLGEAFARSPLTRRDLAKQSEAGIIALYGDLGAGKTSFTQGFAMGLGIKKRIISPTFIVVREYRIRNQELGIRNFCHVDLYRINDKSDSESLGLLEMIEDKNNIIVIEWAEKLGGILPKKP